MLTKSLLYLLVLVIVILLGTIFFLDTIRYLLGGAAEPILGFSVGFDWDVVTQLLCIFTNF